MEGRGVKQQHKTKPPKQNSSTKSFQKKKRFRMVLLNQTRLQKGELAVNFRLYRILFYYQPCPAWQLQKRVRLSILAFGLPNLGFTAVLLLLIQHGFLFSHPQPPLQFTLEKEEELNNNTKQNPQNKTPQQNPSKKKSFRMVLLNQTRLQKGELAVNFRLYRILFYYQPCPAWQLQKRVRLSILYIL